jgi:hypothetical protein
MGLRLIPASLPRRAASSEEAPPAAPAEGAAAEGAAAAVGSEACCCGAPTTPPLAISFALAPLREAAAGEAEGCLAGALVAQPSGRGSRIV